MFAAIHHNKNKQATASFYLKGQYTRVNLGHKSDRAAAMSHVKSFYPGATKISIIFFVPAITAET